MQRRGSYTPSASKTSLERMFHLSKQVHQAAQTAALCKDECHKIDSKIGEITNYLQYTQAISPTNEKLKTQINDFENIISSSLEFVQQCNSTNKHKEFSSSNHHENTYNTLKKQLNDYISLLHTDANKKEQSCGEQCKRRDFLQPVVFPMGPCANGRCSPRPMLVPMGPCANGGCAKPSACFLNGRRVPCNQIT